jgi:hypothetical protein
MITVDVLYHEDCTHYPTAIRYVKEVLAEEGIDATVNEINIATVEAAQELNFVGSPTIRINGEDIESEMEQQRRRPLDQGLFFPNRRLGRLVQARRTAASRDRPELRTL